MERQGPSASRYRELVGSMSTSVIVIDSDFQIIYLNAAAEVLIGLSASRLASHPLWHWLFLLEREREMLIEAFASGHPYTIREAKVTTAKGVEHTLDYSVSPIVFDGEALLIELQSRDRLLRIEREEELQERHATTRNLVRGMAHEIKNPLGGIRGAAQLLERELNDKQLSEYTQVIISEADRLRDLVDRLLGPRRAPERSVINIHSVLEHVAALVSAEGLNGIVLQRDYDPSIPELMGDHGQLIQAALNIVRNALQSLQAHTVESPVITLRTRARRQVTLGAHKHKLVCLIEVIDNGVGIGEDVKGSLFFPMISTRAQGSGLGLSISQSIINQHGGLIECRSEPAETVFSLWLPLA
ncbi:MAG: nitrogen regulation protein NR(II) [Pseudomonadales bacterium]